MRYCAEVEAMAVAVIEAGIFGGTTRADCYLVEVMLQPSIETKSRPHRATCSGIGFDMDQRGDFLCGQAAIQVRLVC